VYECVHGDDSKALVVTDTPYKAVDMADIGHKEWYKAVALSCTPSNRSISIHYCCMAERMCVCALLIMASKEQHKAAEQT